MPNDVQLAFFLQNFVAAAKHIASRFKMTVDYIEFIVHTTIYILFLDLRYKQVYRWLGRNV